MFSLPTDTDRIIASSLAEDLGVSAEDLLDGGPGAFELLARDVTTTATVPADALFRGVVVAREACVVAGLPVAARAFEMLAQAAGVWEEGVEFFPLVAEGTAVGPGTELAEVDGLAAVVLAGERTALNLLQVLSGIATEARRWQDAAGPDLQVADSRKTWPGLRSLSKYAVAVGGASNHREGLFDAVLVKDNHLRHASVAQAVAGARKAYPTLGIEIEADTLTQALEAVRAGAEAVMLDNVSDADLPAAVAAVRAAAEERGRPVVIEASGGVTIERLPAIRAAGADRVSTSRITFAPPVDIALDAR